MNASFTLHSDIFRYDLVDVTKEVLQYKFSGVYSEMISAYKRQDLTGVRFVRLVLKFRSKSLEIFSAQAAVLVDILADVEMILASDRRFLLGNWVNDALQFAETEEEIHFYSFNAKLQVSIWGNMYPTELYDYANKFWSGMIREYV